MSSLQLLDAYQPTARTWHAHKDKGWIGGQLVQKLINQADDTVELEFKDEEDKVRTDDRHLGVRNKIAVKS